MRLSHFQPCGHPALGCGASVAPQPQSRSQGSGQGVNRGGRGCPHRWHLGVRHQEASKERPDLVEERAQQLCQQLVGGEEDQELAEEGEEGQAEEIDEEEVEELRSRREGEMAVSCWARRRMPGRVR